MRVRVTPYGLDYGKYRGKAYSIVGVHHIAIRIRGLTRDRSYFSLGHALAL